MWPDELYTMRKIVLAFFSVLLLAVSASGIGPIPSGSEITPDTRWSTGASLVGGSRDPYRTVVGQVVRDPFADRSGWSSQLFGELDFVDLGVLYPAAAPMPPQLTVVFRVGDIGTTDQGDVSWLVSDQEVSDITGYCRVRSLMGDHIPSPFDFVFSWQSQLEARRVDVLPPPSVHTSDSQRSEPPLYIEVVAFMLFGGGILGISLLQRN